MKVTLTESGGWANITKRCVVDIANLPGEAAARLRTAFQTRALFADHPPARDARDARMIVLEMCDAGEVRRTSFSEAATPASARPVLEILRPLCKVVPWEE
ncbi:MAG: protealysin inhibitor emfourin [Pseudomonadota bacterium]